jgi:2-hydroxychromene-2-carboxylate isomerase
VRQVTLYFDFVSPYSYIAFKRLRELPHGVDVALTPVLFAGLLKHFDNKGPAEIAEKRRWTYRWCTWWAKSLGIPFRFPASHPFNPLHHLRLVIAAGANREHVDRIFTALWTTGADTSDPTAFRALAKEFGVDDAKLAAPEVKDKLRKNTEEAAVRGVFGVPTYEVDGERFWGADAIGFVNAFLADASVLQNAEMRRVDGLPVGAARKV